MKFFCTLPACVAISLLLGASAFADPISGLYNTGVDDSGTPLADGSLDSHYTITSAPYSDYYGLPVAAAYNSSNSYPIPPWLGDDSVSSWIAPVGLLQDYGYGSTYDFAGNYDYQTTFEVTGSDLSDLSISGQYAADDGLVGILLNGNSISVSNPGSFSSWTSFTLDQTDAAGDFVTGVNTLDFIVNNQYSTEINPTGLRVEFTPAVPDSDLGMATPALAFGLLIVGSALLNRRNRRLLGSAAS